MPGDVSDISSAHRPEVLTRPRKRDGPGLCTYVAIAYGRFEIWTIIDVEKVHMRFWEQIVWILLDQIEATNPFL